MKQGIKILGVGRKTPSKLLSLATAVGTIIEDEGDVSSGRNSKTRGLNERDRTMLQVPGGTFLLIIPGMGDFCFLER